MINIYVFKIKRKVKMLKLSKIYNIALADIFTFTFLC